jgi:glycosyltransferase involved in cell wall biosynthesis
MRILLLPSAYAPAVGGVEELTRRLADRLAEGGDAVEVWTNRHPAALPAREMLDGHVVRRFDLAMPAMRGAAAAAFARRAPATLAGMVRAARAFAPDVLHVQCFSNNGVYATALSAILRRPLVVSLQGETVMDDRDIYERSAFLRRSLGVGLRRAAAVTGCSAFTLGDAERFGLAPGAGRVVFNGVDVERRAELEPFPVPSERFVFAVGRFVEKKGFDLLLEAYAAVAERVPDLGLVIGGDGAARAGLEARVDELGLGARVSLPGRLAHGQVAWAMGRATAFVLPSRVEPFGIVVLEALREGCPAIVSSRGGAVEIVGDRAGLVADPLDRDALATAIERLATDDVLRGELTAAGRARVADFDWARVAEQYRSIYADVVAPVVQESGPVRRTDAP